jgi:hypothetical protein
LEQRLIVFPMALGIVPRKVSAKAPAKGLGLGQMWTVFQMISEKAPEKGLGLGPG